MIIFAWILWSYLLFAFSLVLLEIIITKMKYGNNMTIKFRSYEDLIFKISIFVFLSIYLFH